MIVTIASLDSVIERIEKSKVVSLDTETTGLLLWRDDSLFSIIIGIAGEAFYFNFWGMSAHDGSFPPEESILPRESTFRKIEKALCGKYIFMHNAKFDLCALDKEGIKIDGTIHDTEVGARLERNDLLSYELGECAKRIGEEKSSAVDDYIEEHKLWEWKAVPGKKSRVKNKFFYRVPFEVISAYGLRDAEVTFKLGTHQLESVRAFDELHSSKGRLLAKALEMEREVTPVAFSMEKFGMQINLPYCDEAIEYEDARAKKVMQEFKILTGFEFKDSGKHLAQVFSAQGFEVPQTDKGNPSFTDDILEEFKNPVAALVQEYRDAHKRANTYFRSFKFYADDNGVLHTNLRQAGTATGRFSSANPNLQNISKDEDAGLKFPIRRAFVPRKDFIFVMIDYNQMEFRLMLDYAGQLDLIERIMNGHDPHQATADLVNIPRKPAKTLNFGLLYGMGIEKLSNKLNISVMEAKKFRYKYFSNLPEVQVFLNSASKRAKYKGLVRDWLGRVFYFDNPEFSYKAANAIIQGGCSSVVKLAMIRLAKFLDGKKSRMLMQLHDELIFEVHKSEVEIVPKLREIMETVYPYRHIPLTCSVSHSLESWGDPVEGMPDFAEGNKVQEKSSGRTQSLGGVGDGYLVH